MSAYTKAWYPNLELFSGTNEVLPDGLDWFTRLHLAREMQEVLCEIEALRRERDQLEGVRRGLVEQIEELQDDLADAVADAKALRKAWGDAR